MIVIAVPILPVPLSRNLEHLRDTRPGTLTVVAETEVTARPGTDCSVRAAALARAVLTLCLALQALELRLQITLRELLFQRGQQPVRLGLLTLAAQL